MDSVVEEIKGGKMTNNDKKVLEYLKKMRQSLRNAQANFQKNDVDVSEEMDAIEYYARQIKYYLSTIPRKNRKKNKTTK